MSSGYALHPEAYADLDEIRGFIAQNNPDAANRVISQIFDAIRGLGRFPNQGHRRPDLTSRPLRFALGSGISNCLCRGTKALVGYRGDARTAQPTNHGRNSERQGI